MPPKPAPERTAGAGQWQSGWAGRKRRRLWLLAPGGLAALALVPAVRPVIAAERIKTPRKSLLEWE
jgi:hypothetical protein